MKRLILSVLAVFAIAAVVVGCGSSNTSLSDNTQLQGTWTVIVPGTEVPPDLTMAYTFSSNNWSWTETLTSITVVQMSGTFTLDSTANPKTIDLYITYCPSLTELVGNTSLGIYQLSGTNLTLGLGDPGSARPTSFTEDETITLVKQ